MMDGLGMEGVSRPDTGGSNSTGGFVRALAGWFDLGLWFQVGPVVNRETDRSVGLNSNSISTGGLTLTGGFWTGDFDRGFKCRPGGDREFDRVRVRKRGGRLSAPYPSPRAQALGYRDWQHRLVTVQDDGDRQ